MWRDMFGATKLQFMISKVHWKTIFSAWTNKFIFICGYKNMGHIRIPAAIDIDPSSNALSTI